MPRAIVSVFELASRTVAVALRERVLEPTSETEGVRPSEALVKPALDRDGESDWLPSSVAVCTSLWCSVNDGVSDNSRLGVRPRLGVKGALGVGAGLAVIVGLAVEVRVGWRSVMRATGSQKTGSPATGSAHSFFPKLPSQQHPFSRHA